MSNLSTRVFDVRDYDLAATLTSGQAFRWRFEGGRWTSVIGSRWVRLAVEGSTITAEVAGLPSGWSWLEEYLQLDVDLDQVLRTFPDDGPMRAAVASCRGLRLLRQDPWECLASFILSSTKQIVQIQQVIDSLCSRFGEPVLVPAGTQPAYSFPAADRLATVSEPDLRSCRMGFRAPYLKRAAQLVSSGELDLKTLKDTALEAARNQLISLPGVGRKIADCVLLFALGFGEAFPVDVWVSKALRQLYFPGRSVSLKRLQAFSTTHFGRNAGYAQQYLFHYVRRQCRRIEPTVATGNIQ